MSKSNKIGDKTIKSGKPFVTFTGTPIWVPREKLRQIRSMAVMEKDEVHPILTDDFGRPGKYKIAV